MGKVHKHEDLSLIPSALERKKEEDGCVGAHL